MSQRFNAETFLYDAVNHLRTSGTLDMVTLLEFDAAITRIHQEI